MLSSTILISVISLHTLWALPVSNSSDNSTNSDVDGVFFEEPVQVNNVTYVPKDLYVIRTLVYEIGILTDADPNVSDDSASEVLQDEINIKYMQPPRNDSFPNWWETFNNNSSQGNISGIAFERVIPLGMTLLAKPTESSSALPGGATFYSTSYTEEETDENEEENYILP